MMKNKPTPLVITLHKRSRILEIAFDTGETFHLPCAYLRAFSTSAEEKHSSDVKDAHVSILAIEPVGNYAIKPTFSDGHRTGIYSWDTLYQLGRQQSMQWRTPENGDHA